jgi:hypothetical protein
MAPLAGRSTMNSMPDAVGVLGIEVGQSVRVRPGAAEGRKRSDRPVDRADDEQGGEQVEEDGDDGIEDSFAA